MASIKEAIEEVIEESYLLNLTTEEIRQDFEKFIETCFEVIKSNVRNPDSLAELNKELAREKTCILIDEFGGSEGGIPLYTDDSNKDVPSTGFAEKVARRKCLILKAIAESDPKLVRLIDEHRFSGEIPNRQDRKLIIQRDKGELRMLLLQIGYGVTVAVIILLMYLGLSLKP